MSKIDLSQSKELFNLAISYSNAAERDQDDPASSNLLMSLHNYFEAAAVNLIAITEAIGKLDDRLAALERNATGPLSTKLK